MDPDDLEAQAERVRRHSLLDGVEPDPVGITSWAQPWVPLWIDYELSVKRMPAPDEIDGWRLGAVDAELALGAEKAVAMASKVVERVRRATGLLPPT